MAFFDDFANGITGYPDASVKLSIVDRVLVTGTLGVVNVNEVWKFKVRIENNGNLNMTSVSLHILASSGAMVSTSSAGPWTSSITAGSLRVNAHGSQKSVDYFFKAPSTTKPAGTLLVSAHIAGYDVNLDYLTNSLTGHPLSPEGTYTDQVVG